MPDSLGTVMSYVLIPVATMIVGGVAAAFRPPGPSLRSWIQHFAAGVVFSAVGVELLPDILGQDRLLQIGVGFSIGVVFMLSLKALSQRMESDGEGGQSTGLVVTVGIDIFIDGLLLGLAFVSGEAFGILLTLALAMELLSLGLSVAASLNQTPLSRGRVIVTTAGLALLVGIGAAIGTTLFAQLSAAVLEVFLSFGLAALLYLVTEELLVEAHAVEETPLAAGMFFAGFLLFLVIGQLAHG
jgi:ZIP family zinc transporter